MKKFFILLLSGALIATSVPVNGFAAEKVTTDVIVANDTKDKVTEPSDKALKKVILAVKEKVTIPEEYSNFNYNFNDSNIYSDAYWSLTWSSTDSNKGITVNCDVDNHITYYYKYDYSKSVSGIAKYLKNELQAKAEAFIAKIAPEVNGYLKMVDSGYIGIYNGDYYYTFNRVKNGVDFPDNSVTVNVNSITGEVTMVSINWLYDTNIPTSGAKLTKEDAVSLIKKNMKMKLVYRTNNNIIYDKAVIASDDTMNAYLAYVPSQDYISIDARSGEVYNSRTQWVDGSANMGGSNGIKDKMAAADISTGSTAQLTKDEIAKIEELKNLISKSKAIKLVLDNSSLYLDKNLTKYTATLDKYYYGNSEYTYVWYINLSDPREVKDTDTYRAYAWAAVDASTGKIISYYAGLKSNYDNTSQKWKSIKIKYNKEESRAFLEKFMKSQMQERYANTVLSDEKNDYIAYYDKKDKAIYGGYSFQYNRVNEGIEFPDNNITGSVDGVTGKIYAFGCNWNNKVNFQSSNGVISADQAMDDYLSKDGFGLKYEINQINKTDTNSKTAALSTDYKIRLVYRPDINPSYISPFTGEQMDLDGEIYTETKPYSYKDIDNSDSNKNILILADMNIGFEGESFLPNQNITLGEIETLLKNVGYSSDVQGDDSKSITREELAGLFINWLGLEKLSNLTLYSTGYSDEKSIDSKYVGAVALAKGLGLMNGDSNNNFNPKKNLTRYEAVNYIMNYITVQRDGVLY